MILPKTVEHPNLVETIVEVRLTPNPELERDLWAGILASRLNKIGYRYQSIPQLNISQESGDPIKITISNEDSSPSTNLFVNEETGVRVLLNGPTISFNCPEGKYIGWDNYFEKISEILRIIDSERIALSYERTMIRYISEYDFNILDKVDIDINSHADDGYRTLEINLGRQEGSAVAYISISGLRERFPRSSREKRISSLFDVNVFDRLTENATYDDVCSSLCKIHHIEKESYFGLLKEDYVKSLNPLY